MADADRDSTLELSFEARVFYWRGPSPFFFAAIPPDLVDAVRRVARAVTYGWGMIPVEARIGDVAFKTSLYPKDETYLLPLKVDVRRRANITAGDLIAVALTIQLDRP